MGKGIKFTCPKCGASLKSPLEDSGKRFPCPTCGNEVLVPPVQPAAPPKPPATEKVYELDKSWTDEFQQAEKTKNWVAQQPKNLGPSVMRPPEYRPIISGAGVLWFFAALCYVAGVLGLVVSIMTIVDARAHPPMAGSTTEDYLRIQAEEIQHKVRLVSLVSGSIMAFVMGAFLNLLSHLSLAIRDIARNSFK